MDRQPQRGRRPKHHAILRPRRSEQERGSHEQEDQADVADEVLAL
jgi:hypothetical protein